MTFDYGPNPPPEPSPLDVFDAIAATTNSGHTPMAPIATVPPPTTPTPPRAPPPAPRRQDGPTLADLDTGRFSVGDVVVDDVPGLVDSTLFKSMTPTHVDVALMAGLETTRQAGVDIAVPVYRMEIEGRADEIGDVVVVPVPGLFGSDLFKTDIDIAAGAAAAGDILEVTPNAGRPRKAKSDGGLRPTVCASCSTVHFLARCPICGTAVPGDG